MPKRFEYSNPADEPPRFVCQLEKLRCQHVNPKTNHHCRRYQIIGAGYCFQHLETDRHLKIAASTVPNSGLGLFAYDKKKPTGEILFKYNSRKRRGDFIIEYEGEVLSKLAGDQRYGKNNTAPYSAYLNKDFEIDSACLRASGSLANHKPRTYANARLIVTGKNVYLEATKTIRNGDEIFIDYGKDYNIGQEGDSYTHKTKNIRTHVHHATTTRGGKLSVVDLKSLLHASYDNKQHQVGDFHLDKELSSKTSKVYVNPKTGQTVVAHRGTSGFSDWLNNAVYAYGGKKAYQYTPRYKEAERVQHQAEAKYGKTKVSTIGHSQGGLQSELLGDKSKEIITLNKATRPFSNTKHTNQTDIRTEKDIVSRLNPFQKKNEKDIVIPSNKKSSYVKEHGIDTLDRLDNHMLVGNGIMFYY